MCFHAVWVCVPISSAMLSSTSMLRAWAACSRAVLLRPPLSTDVMTDDDADEVFLSAAAAAAAAVAAAVVAVDC